MVIIKESKVKRKGQKGTEQDPSIAGAFVREVGDAWRTVRRCWNRLLDRRPEASEGTNGGHGGSSRQGQDGVDDGVAAVSNTVRGIGPLELDPEWYR
ncbi:hypothetical protein CVT26_012185 [Gymnopilus dilepis]|uniref:Uncharacterized protein n=1 Tax=Gymnopilus dilepis TaxID=231916 RepID=A0A409W5P9_9AGAR|nr:hypothetical protein CVT26_012185 [Gymnopilus dilepis]